MLALVSLADGLSRSGRPFGIIPFWIGLVVPIAVLAFRQATPDVTRSERLALSVLAGIFLYLVKVLHDPFGFTSADEFNQVYNTTTVFRTGSLFTSNPLLPVTPDYPGLASVTAALASVTHLSLFGAGVIVVGAARMIMILALYRLFDLITASPRVAGLGVLGYVCAPNFLFFTAQFSYESLALPIATVAVYAVASWLSDRPRPCTAWAITALLLIAAVVPTHHLTSYALCGFLLALFIANWIVGGGWWKTSPLPFVVFALASTVGWLVFVASQTVGYLNPVFTNALHSTFATIANEGAGARQLFEPKTTAVGVATPLWDRGLAITAVVLTILLLPVGVHAVWRGYGRNPLLLVLTVAAAAYIATFGLRLIPEAWEIANRASEFLFLGVGIALAFAWIRLLGPSGRFTHRVSLALTVAVIFAGGAASSVRAEMQLAQAIRVAVGDRVIEPQGLTAARWSRTWIRSDKCNAFAASEANSRLMFTYGNQTLGTKSLEDAKNVLDLPRLEPWQIAILRNKALRYVVMHRLEIGTDNIAGYFFATRNSPPVWRLPIPAAIYRKFDGTTASRIFDSGDLTIYDVARLVQDRAGGLLCN